MRYVDIVVWSVVVLAASVATATRVAAAPLLVVVESTDRAATDAKAVRRSIEAELGTPVLAPATAEQIGPADVLVIAVDQSQIWMSLRTSTTAVVTRTIGASTDRATRDRQIAWLAGNLARDQVGPLIAAEELPERPVAPHAAAEETPADASKPAALDPLSPPPQPARAAEPPSPPLPEPAPRPMEVASAVAPPAPAHEGPRWTVTAAGGRALGPKRGATVYNDGIFPLEPTYQLEVARDAGRGGVILGAALDMGSSTSNRLAGLAGFAGKSLRYGRWLLETTAGAGVELVTLIVPQYTFSGGTNNVEASSTIRTALYLRGTGSLGFAASSNIDLLVGLTIHITTAGSSYDFAGGTAGLRYRMP